MLQDLFCGEISLEKAKVKWWLLLCFVLAYWFFFVPSHPASTHHIALTTRTTAQKSYPHHIRIVGPRGHRHWWRASIHAQHTNCRDETFVSTTKQWCEGITRCYNHCVLYIHSLCLSFIVFKTCTYHHVICSRQQCCSMRPPLCAVFMYVCPHPMKMHLTLNNKQQCNGTEWVVCCVLVLVCRWEMRAALCVWSSIRCFCGVWFLVLHSSWQPSQQKHRITAHSKTTACSHTGKTRREDFITYMAYMYVFWIYDICCKYLKERT